MAVVAPMLLSYIPTTYPLSPILPPQQLASPVSNHRPKLRLAAKPHTRSNIGANPPPSAASSFPASPRHRASSTMPATCTQRRAEIRQHRWNRDARLPVSFAETAEVMGSSFWLRMPAETATAGSVG